MSDGGALVGLRLDVAQSVLDRLRAAVIALDLDGRLTYANAYAEQVYGWTERGSTIGRTDIGDITAAVRAGLPSEGDFTTVRPDGEKVLVHATDSGLYDAGGELVGVLSIISDIEDDAGDHAAESVTDEAAALRFLLEATTVVAAASAYEDALQRLAQLAVPVLGDLCLIDVVEDDAIVRMAAVHADPSKADLVNELVERYPPDPGGTHPAAIAMREGLSFVSPIMTPTFLAATTRDERHFEIVQELGFTSYMCAPLRARDRLLGSLTVVSAGSGRIFEERDLALAQELANRAGLVIENTRLLAERTRTARALQAALLPPVLPVVDGIDVAARYRAAGEAVEVGGDFYDIFAAADGTWTAIVGDVCGTGPAAAAAAGIVRHGLHAAALCDRDPVSMLDTADELLEHEQLPNAARFCSACVAVLDRRPDDVRVVVASAGHPEPWVVRAGGLVEPVGARGSLLGLGLARHRTSAAVALGHGDLLVLYTDGVTEARSPHGGFFGDRWAELLTELPRASADAAAGALLDGVDAFTAGQLRDDVAILVVRAC